MNEKMFFNLKVLAESEQIRREADNIGPRAELDYWKKRMTKFNFLLDQIKGQDVKAVLTILQTAKSKLIQVNDTRFSPIEQTNISLSFLAMAITRWKNYRCSE